MCIHPLTKKINPTDEDVTVLSCGQCFECLKHRAADWAFRVKHELSMHEESCYLTLTYDEKSKHEDAAYSYYDFQNFLKRIRNYQKKKIAHFTSLEYGSKNGRLHFHTIIFGYYPKNAEFLRTSPSGYPLYSEEKRIYNDKSHRPLNQLWPYGYHSFAPATIETAYYIASYALKNNTTINQDGEILSDSLKTSRNPAIGLIYFHKNYEQLVASSIHHNKRLPRYYEKKLEEYYYSSFASYKEHHEANIRQTNGDQMARFLNNESKPQGSTFRTKKDTSVSLLTLQHIEKTYKK